VDEIERFPLGLLRRLAMGDLDQDELEVVESWIRQDGVTQPPSRVVDRARRIPRSGTPSGLRRLVAKLLEGGSLAPAFAGTRTRARPSFLSYVADESRIDLELTGTGERTVVGQVTGGGPWTWAYLETEQGELIQSDVDEAGMFAFPPARDPRAVTVTDRTLEIYAALPREHDAVS